MTSVRVDATKCLGYGLCVLNAPDVFELDESTNIAAVVAKVTEATIAGVQQAVIECPTGAITLEEEGGQGR